MKSETASFALQAVRTQMAALLETVDAALGIIEVQQESAPCTHPVKDRIDRSTFTRANWACRICGHKVDEPHATDERTA